MLNSKEGLLQAKAEGGTFFTPKWKDKKEELSEGSKTG